MVMTMPDLCTDNRFELIEKYRQRLIEATNIETRPDEMKVLDSILFRFWQMGWLDRLEEEKHGRWEDTNAGEQIVACSRCGWVHDIRTFGKNYCPNCGARMDGGTEDETD